MCAFCSDVMERIFFYRNDPGDQPSDDARTGGDSATTTHVHRSIVLKCIFNIVHIPYPTDSDAVRKLCQKRSLLTQECVTLEGLLKQYPHVCEETTSGGWTLLHTACACGNIEAIDVILKNTTIDINAIDNDGWTAVHCLTARILLLCSQNIPEFARLKSTLDGLLGKGANIIRPVIDDSLPVRHSLTRRLWAGTFDNMKCMLYIDNHCEHKGASEEEYIGTYWTETVPVRVKIRFLPLEYRRVVITTLQGQEVLRRQYYVEDAENVIRPLPEDKLTTVPREDDLSTSNNVFMEVSETLLPASAPWLQNVWFALTISETATYSIRFRPGRCIIPRVETYEVVYRLE
eukprot:PhF_6_TR31877/c4_g1_i4/m.47363